MFLIGYIVQRRDVNTRFTGRKGMKCSLFNSMESAESDIDGRVYNSSDGIDKAEARARYEIIPVFTENNLRPDLADDQPPTRPDP